MLAVGLTLFLATAYPASASDVQAEQGLTAPLTTAAIDRYNDLFRLAQFEQAATYIREQGPQGASAQADFAYGLARIATALQRFLFRGVEFGLFVDSPIMDEPALGVPRDAFFKPEATRVAFTYEANRAWLDRLALDLSEASALLAQVKGGDWEFPLADFSPLSALMIGLQQHFTPTGLQMLGPSGNRAPVDTPSDQVVVFLDQGDNLWLQGYSQTFIGLVRAILAYDWEDSFDRTAHLLTLRAKTNYPLLLETYAICAQGSSHGNARGSHSCGSMQSFLPLSSDFIIVDMLAAIHGWDWRLADPVSLRESLDAFLAVTALSKASWDSIRTEAVKAQLEWIPNARQRSLIHAVNPDFEITEAMMDRWVMVMDELHAVLSGRTLVPFWRPTARPYAVNVNAFFTQPTARFVPVYVLQGSLAAPHLVPLDRTNRHMVTTTDFWADTARIFNDDLAFYSLVIN